jgi:phage terminase small subunit
MSSKRKPPTVEMTRATPVDDDLDGLRTDRQVLFVIEYCRSFNATQAAIRAGYAERSAAEIGCELLRKPRIEAAVERRLAQIADEAMVDSVLVISELYQMATADPRELMRVEIDCCRHCYGIDHKYHWTEPEYRRALNAATKDGKPAPDVEGFFGFDPRREPHPDCPDCFGRGVERVSITPSRKLSRGAARLLASVKQTKDGCIELKTHDQLAALQLLGRTVGAFVDKSELSGPGGSPLQLQPVLPLQELNPEQLEAIIRASGHPVLQGYPLDKPLTSAQIEAITGGSK